MLDPVSVQKEEKEGGRERRGSYTTSLQTLRPYIYIFIHQIMVA